MTNEEEKLRALNPRLTDDFLETAREAARVYGWSGDHIETAAFLRWLYEQAGKPEPNVECYEWED